MSRSLSDTRYKSAPTTSEMIALAAIVTVVVGAILLVSPA